MQAAKLIVIRHGETEWNSKGIWQGQLDSPLTEKGVSQANAVGQRLKDFLPIESIYSSDLGRCLRCAQLAADLLGLEVRTDLRLRERSFGVIEGMEKKVSQVKFPGVWDRLNKRDENFAPEGGESLKEKQMRFDEIYNELAEENKGRTVVVFTHGGGVDAILRSALGITMKMERPYTLWNCAINVFSFKKCCWSLDTLGDVSHLKGIESTFRLQ